MQLLCKVSLLVEVQRKEYESKIITKYMSCQKKMDSPMVILLLALFVEVSMWKALFCGQRSLDARHNPWGIGGCTGKLLIGKK